MNAQCSVVIFSNKAYNAIIQETFDKHPVETGGILLGHVVDDAWVVMEVIPPGINSIFEYAYFEYDHKFVNYLADKVASKYKRPLTLLGLWHRHPGSMDVFSQTDDDTNRKFADLSDHGTISGLVNVDPDFRITMYHLDHEDRPLQTVERPQYTKVKIEVGDDIIPEHYFELKYCNSNKIELHPKPEDSKSSAYGDGYPDNDHQQNSLDKSDIEATPCNILTTKQLTHELYARFCTWLKKSWKYIFAVVVFLLLLGLAVANKNLRHSKSKASPAHKERVDKPIKEGTIKEETIKEENKEKGQPSLESNI